jgi:MFS family permease
MLNQTNDHPGSWIDRDGKTVFLEKTVRTIPYGFLGVIFGVYLAQLGFSVFAIGIVLTLTVLSSAFYTFIVSFLADRIGRRRTLIFFALTELCRRISPFPLDSLVGSCSRRDCGQYDGGFW